MKAILPLTVALGLALAASSASAQSQTAMNASAAQDLQRAARALNSAPGLEALPRPAGAGAESGWQRFQRCGGYCCFVTTNLCLVYIFEYVISSGLAAKVLPAALGCSYTAAAACDACVPPRRGARDRLRGHAPSPVAEIPRALRRQSHGFRHSRAGPPPAAGSGRLAFCADRPLCF